MDEFSPKDLVGDLWKNKPLFITVLVGLAAVAYIIYRQNTSSTASTTASSTTPTTSGGTFIEDSYPVFVPVSTTTSSGASTPVASTGNGTPIPTPTPTPSTGGPSGIFYAKGSSATPTPAVGSRITVSAWPAQTSTLWGIAEKAYGNGALWPQIYTANKSTIGSNPNLLKPGQSLVIPPKS